MSVAPFATVIVPPAALLFAVNDERLSVPELTERFPFIVVLPPSVFVPLPEIMIF